MKTVLYSYLFVALGGALGAVARFSLNLLLQRDVDFPWGTLTANLLGCFLMPLGEQFRRPSPFGAVATKNSFCRATQRLMRSSIS